MAFTARDRVILEETYALRCPTSGQLARLLGASSQIIRRRARRELIPQRYLMALDRDPNQEQAFCLGRAGLQYMSSILGKVTYPRISKGRTRSLFWEHTSLAVDVAVAFKRAVLDTACPFRLLRYAPEDELGESLCCRPDGMLLVAPKAPASPVVAFALEIDRATESIPRVTKKLKGYLDCWRRQRYASLATPDGAPPSALRILFIVADVTTTKRICNMQRAIRGFAGDHLRDAGEREAFLMCFRFALANALEDERAVVHEPIWFDVTGPRRLFQRPDATTISIQDPKGDAR